MLRYLELGKRYKYIGKFSFYFVPIQENSNSYAILSFTKNKNLDFNLSNVSKKELFQNFHLIKEMKDGDNSKYFKEKDTKWKK